MKKLLLIVLLSLLFVSCRYEETVKWHEGKWLVEAKTHNIKGGCLLIVSDISDPSKITSVVVGPNTFEDTKVGDTIVYKTK